MVLVAFLKKVVPLGISLAIIAVCFIIMKKTWWDTLPKDNNAG